MRNINQAIQYETELMQKPYHIEYDVFGDYKVEKLFCYSVHVATAFISSDENVAQVCSLNFEENNKSVMKFLHDNNVDAPNEQFVKAHYFM